MIAAACSTMPSVGMRRSTNLVARYRSPLPPPSALRYGAGVLALSRQPYLRWAGAIALVAIAFVWDLSGRSTEPIPVAASDIARGAVLSEHDVDWIDVQKGLLTAIDPVGYVAATAIEAGDPLTRSLLATTPAVPSDWWTIPIDTPASVAAGTPVRLVGPNGLTITGVVVAASREDSFGIVSSGLAAVPPDYADELAVAASTDQLIVLFGP